MAEFIVCELILQGAFFSEQTMVYGIARIRSMRCQWPLSCKTLCGQLLHSTLHWVRFLGPLLHVLYTADLSNIICAFGARAHQNANDVDFYVYQDTK